MSQPSDEGPAIIDQGLGLMPQDNNQGGQQEQQQQEEVKINPAWNNLLSRVPQGLHGQILPELKQWDQNYQQGIQKVHSQYAAYKPFLEQQIDPNQLNEAYMIRQALEQDPMQFVKSLIEYYKLELPTEQGQQPIGDEGDEENLYDFRQDPEWQQQQQMVQTMAQALLAQNQETLDAKQDAELDQMLGAASQKYGQNFNEEWMLQHLMTNGVETVTPEIIDQAQEAYMQHVQSIIQNYRSPSQNAPVMMGGGGGLPSQQTPVGSMTGKDRRALIVQTLMNNANSGG